MIVALDGETTATAALGFAFEEAQLQHLRLVALHTGSAGSEGKTALLGELFAGHRQRHPDVAVSIVQGLATAAAAGVTRSPGR